MDSTGLTLLTRLSLAAERDGFALALIAGNDRIQRLFEITGWSRISPSSLGRTSEPCPNMRVS